eukprot:TRINITY_DN734_c1_g4_i1.p2 TRINITY_DN734_c1_g4~~TRINITY_DN734_c1_g4_i1.p2  ORF type:complete len:109 (+),score=15.86 TRINITY_DN734_c1_g4_i1:73-399(+)
MGFLLAEIYENQNAATIGPEANEGNEGNEAKDTSVIVGSTPKETADPHQQMGGVHSRDLLVHPRQNPQRTSRISQTLHQRHHPGIRPRLPSRPRYDPVDLEDEGRLRL